MPRLKTYQYLIFPVIVLTALLSVRLLGGQATRYASKKIKPLSASQPTNKEPTRKDSLSKQIGDTALAQEIDRALDESDLRQARWGVFVMTLNDGRVLKRTVAQFKGTPELPLDSGELREKFLLLTRHCQPDLMCAMFERLQSLESESSLDWIGLQ